MLTLKDIMEILPLGTKVRCRTMEQRQYVIRTLIDAGAEHGDSGFSRRVYDGTSPVSENHYMSPGLSESYRGGVYATAWSGDPGNKSISFEEFESFVDFFNTTFDDGDIVALLM